MLKWMGGLLIAVLFFLGLGTYLALELSEVLSVATVNHTTGEIRLTHIWFVQNNEQLILEAGNPENPWVQDIEKHPSVQISGEAVDGQYKLLIEQDRPEHDKVRSLMRAKYGWRDIWVATLFDTSKSKLVVAAPNN